MTLTPDVNPLEGNATDSVTLTCSWNTTVFYLVWFKDGTLLYSRDLVSGVTVDNTGASVGAEVEGQNSTLTFSQVSDSGNYTCAVTCRAKGRAEEDIPLQNKATKEVLIYGGLTRRNRSSSDSKAAERCTGMFIHANPFYYCVVYGVVLHLPESPD